MRDGVASAFISVIVVTSAVAAPRSQVEQARRDSMRAGPTAPPKAERSEA